MRIKPMEGVSRAAVGEGRRANPRRRSVLRRSLEPGAWRRSVRAVTWLLCFGLGMASAAWCQAGSSGSPESPVTQPQETEADRRARQKRERDARSSVERLLRERSAALIAYNHRLPALRTERKREEAYRKYFPSPQKWAPRLFAVHEAYPGTQGAAEALVWIVQHLDDNQGQVPRGTVPAGASHSGQGWERRARRILLKDHIHRPELVALCSALDSETRSGARQDLEHLLQQSPIPAVRMAALVQLCRLDLTRWQSGQEASAKQRLDARLPQLESVLAKQTFEGRTGAQWAAQLQRELTYFSLGQEFLDWKAKDLDGKAQSLRAYRGQVVILFFWKAGSNACRKVLPHLEALRNQSQSEPLAWVGVSNDVSAARAKRWKSVMKLRFEQWHAPPGADGSNAFGVTDWPTFYVLDADGTLLAARVGWTEASRIAKAALRRLKRPKPAEKETPVPADKSKPNDPGPKQEGGAETPRNRSKDSDSTPGGKQAR